jgi:curved DNA-binding protein CbpA
MANNYYQILGVSQSASLQEIKTAYKSLAMKYHPDRNPDNPQAEEQFKKINEIYQTLSDEYKRMTYDYLLLYQSQNSIQFTNPQSTAQPYSTPYNPAYQNSYSAQNNDEPAQDISINTKRNILIFTFVSLILICISAVLLYRISKQMHEKRVLNQAQQYLEEGDKLKALKNLNEILSQKPNQQLPLKMRASIHLEYQNYWQAIEDYTRLIDTLNTKDSSLYFNRGKACFYLNQYQAAKSDFDQAISLDGSQNIYFLYRSVAKKRMNPSLESICKDWEKGKKATKNMYFEEMQEFCR